MSSTGEKVAQDGGKAVVGGLRGQAPGQSSARKKLEKYLKKFLEKTVGVWSFPCVNSFFWAIFLAIIFVLFIIPFAVAGFFSNCQALLGLCIWQGVDLLIVAVVCIMYLYGHYRESAWCINLLNAVIVLSVAGCLAGIILFIVILVNIVLPGSTSIVTKDFNDLQCIPSEPARLAAILSLAASVVLLFIFIFTCCGTYCYLKITGKTSTDRHYCCPKLNNCPGNGFGEEEVEEDND